MSCVYKLAFPDDSVYIGSTDGDPEDRWRNGWGYHPSQMVFKAIFYFGWKNVKKEILEDNLTHDEAKNSEKKQISLHSAFCTVLNDNDNPAREYDSNHGSSSQRAQVVSMKTIENRQNHLEERKEAKRKYVVPVVPKPNGVYRCPVDVFDLNGNFLCTYPNAKAASEELNVNHGNVSSCCKGVDGNGKKRYRTGNYIFRYHNPEYMHSLEQDHA